jgi:catechol 2,3-dioxygenase-like lactoylglutathione lyase family enzyme
MAISFDKVIPILRIFDVPKAKAFYVDFLGFAVDWEHHFDDDSPAYMPLSRGRFLLHLSEPHGDACPGSTVFVWMTGIEEFHREITGRSGSDIRTADGTNRDLRYRLAGPIRPLHDIASRGPLCIRMVTVRRDPARTFRAAS